MKISEKIQRFMFYKHEYINKRVRDAILLKVTKKFFHVALFIVLYNVGSILSLLMKSQRLTIEIKTTRKRLENVG